jgi:GAF domain-containing protein
MQEMLATMVHLTQRGFGLYHAHVFLYHEGDEELQIMACGYKEGDEHEGTHGTSVIPLAQEQSLVARCARTRQAVIVNDVQSDPGWLPNPLLPDTQAEMAVPMIVGDKLLGVLDVQAEQVDAFTDADATIQMTLAAQVAVAVQNILQFQTSQKMASDLNVVTEVGIAATTISDANRLLQEVVDLSKESFNLYHAHIYLVDKAGETLELASGAGKVGRQMVSEGRSIPLDSEKSLVARAARTHEGVVVNDVRSDPDFLPNPLLPDTRAEMAVPMLVAGKVIGVLDVQSEAVGRFTEIDVNIQTTLAAQIAVAVENARAFANTQKQAERETRLNTIAQKIQSTVTIEEAMQIAVRELGHALGKRQTLVALDPAALGVSTNETRSGGNGKSAPEKTETGVE